MAKSMTAYGRSRQTIDGRDITVEIKAVNNKTLETSVKLPRQYLFAEERVKPFIQSCGISRGKVDVFITVDAPPGTGTVFSVDAEYTEGYLEALYQLRDKFALPDDISVMSVASVKDVIIASKPEDDLEADWARISVVLEAAAASFNAGRQNEGDRLAADVKLKLRSISRAVDFIEQNAAGVCEAYEARLYKRLTDTLESLGAKADESRVLTECAIYADRVAIDEEIVRLRSHIVGFSATLDSEGAIGRNLDFWCQEMNRESNTIGSKAQNSVVTSSVIDLKCEIEKIREQIQNIE